MWQGNESLQENADVGTACVLEAIAHGQPEDLWAYKETRYAHHVVFVLTETVEHGGQSA
jgi:hypothetical protein